MGYFGCLDLVSGGSEVVGVSGEGVGVSDGEIGGSWVRGVIQDVSPTEVPGMRYSTQRKG